MNITKSTFILFVSFMLLACHSRKAVKPVAEEWIDPCVKVQEAREDADLKAYLATGELVDVKDQLSALQAKVEAFLKHPHTCRHKDLLR